MAYQKKEGDIVLFRNEKRENEKQPVLRGEALIKDVTYEIALWGRPDRNGNPFWTGVIKPKTQKSKIEREEAPPKELSDEIPF